MCDNPATAAMERGQSSKTLGDREMKTYEAPTMLELGRAEDLTMAGGPSHFFDCCGYYRCLDVAT